MTYVLFELLSGVRVALLQHGLLGARCRCSRCCCSRSASSPCYTAGYLLSAAMVTARASLYTLSVTRRLRQAGNLRGDAVDGVGFLYVLLGLEFYALDVGSVAIFVVLSILFGVTQKVQAAGDARAMPLAHAADAGPGQAGERIGSCGSCMAVEHRSCGLRSFRIWIALPYFLPPNAFMTVKPVVLTAVVSAPCSVLVGRW